MDISTKYSIGDKVYALQKRHVTDSWRPTCEIVIATLFVFNADDYQTEFYTSIDTGETNWSVDDLFDSKEVAGIEADIRNEMASLKASSNRRNHD